jgi:hypothetical protein
MLVADDPTPLDAPNTEGEQVPTPVVRVVLGYSPKRSVEARLAWLERHVRLWMVMSLVMAVTALALAAILAMRLYEVRR